ncbi:MAG: universal stress protein [Bdellovibrionales bacterium]|nr:universal stress protein [Bdellovibrionales bacterium]
MSHVTHKLSGPVEGALAGGGDPATSPLYVFGPFLRLLVVGGVASICFGAAVWLAVLTVVTVSAMYRLVMQWITDGSGGSGLNEEEFGGWAVKINAAITVIEYTLTFLVSIAALVTFVADRFPGLDEHIFGFSYRTHLAVVFSILVGVAVNMGPKVAARTFGPATAAILALLWAMIFATIWKFGLHLPPLKWEAFAPENLHFTLGGYARILALMTGIEIFANLVAAYEGPARVRSRQAFGSLLIIMGTTSLTMLVVGPAIMQVSNPLDTNVSVFTQTMDAILPKPLPYIGSLIGIAVLLSAAAASAQGIQNLSLGLRYRHYIPAWFGQRNRFEVAANPVWLQVAICAVCFLFIGTHEETYLALYAAGVFILLSLTGWAAVKRLLRELRGGMSIGKVSSLAGVIVAALLTSVATIIIFEERFTEGAWMYLVLVPLFYFLFGGIRNRLGSPGSVEDRLGMLLSSSTLPQQKSETYAAGISFANILVPLDQSPTAELALAGAQTIARNYEGTIHVLTAVDRKDGKKDTSAQLEPIYQDSAIEYLDDVVADLSAARYKTATYIVEDEPAKAIVERSKQGDIDLICLTTHGRTLVSRLVVSDVTTRVIYETTPPLLIIRPTDSWRSTRTTFRRILVPLDGSEIAEQILPYVHEIAYKFNSEVTLFSSAEGSESDDFSEKIDIYLKQKADDLDLKGMTVNTVVRSTAPAQTILSVSKELNSDLIMMVSHGRGGIERKEHVKVGSVTERILQETTCPIFLTSAR